MNGPFPKFRELIIRPVHLAMGPEFSSLSAELLSYGTALTESDLSYLQQMGGGPALGLWQMEEATFLDHLEYLERRPDLRDKVKPFALHWPPKVEELPGNLYLGAAMTRIHYWRKRQPLPDPDDLAGLAHYWKTHFNTILGAGKISDFLAHAARIKEG